MLNQTPDASDENPFDSFQHVIIGLGSRYFSLSGTYERCWLSFMPSERGEDFITACAVFDYLWAFRSKNLALAETMISGLKIENAEPEILAAPQSILDHVSTRPGHEEYLYGKLPEDVQLRWNLLSDNQQQEHFDKLWEAYWQPLFDVDNELFDFIIKPAMGAA